MKKFLLILGLGFNLCSNAQSFSESFNDGDFTAAPAWTGTGVWEIVTDALSGPNTSFNSNSLHLIAPTAGTFYLSTPNSNWGTFQAWGLWWGRRAGAQLNANNRNYFWLFSDRADVTDPAVNGYRLVMEVSGGDDEIRLERVNAGAPTTILTTSSGIPSGISDYGILLKVVRTASNQWTILSNFALNTLITGGGDFAFGVPFSLTNSLGSAVDAAPLSISGTGYFSVVAETGGGAAQRAGPEFDQIYFDANGALPVDIISFKAQKNGNKARLDWRVGTESNVSGYVVERSGNGVNFSNIGFISAQAASSYSFTDESILSGQNFYRLKVVDLDATFKYSSIIRVNGSTSGAFVKVFPNPASDRLYVQHSDASTKAQLRVIGIDGKVVQSIRIAENTAQTILDISSVAPGVYHVIYDSGNGERMTQKFIKQ